MKLVYLHHDAKMDVMYWLLGLTAINSYAKGTVMLVWMPYDSNARMWDDVYAFSSNGFSS